MGSTESIIEKSEKESKDLNPFGNNFEKKILSEDTPDREYAQTGSPIKIEKETVPIERVEFDYSKFDTIAQQTAMEDDYEEEEEDLTSEKSQTQHNRELEDPDEIALNKKVQAKIAKSQAKNVVGVYVMLLRAAWKWLGKYSEDKLTAMHIRGEIDMNFVIQQHPLIQHIKQLNSEVDEWDLDEDQVEVIEEAMEIYMVSKNIQTSPGMNLGLAMTVPAIEMLGRAFAQKRRVKSLISSVAEIHQNQVAQSKRKTEIEQNRINQLTSELEESRLKNEELMNASANLVEKPKPSKEALTPSSTSKETPTKRITQKSIPSTKKPPVKSKEPIKILTDERKD